MGVCRAAESEGSVLDLGGLVPSDCVLRSLSEEFFGLVSSELGIQESVRGLMVSQGGSWSSVRSEDLPKGLSDGTTIAVPRREPRQSRVRRGLGTRGRRDPICRR